MAITRRAFLHGTAVGSAALTMSARPTRRSPSDELNVAVVGLRGRGRDHIEGLRKLPGVRIAALCDVDTSFLAREAEKFEKRGEKVDTYVEYRDVLDRKDIDIVSIATPNHWHALQSIWACQAGKDVYVEKPVSHNVWEGRQIVLAAKKYKCVVQTGTQMRSSPAIRAAIAWLHSGGLGRIELARGLCYKPRKSIGKVVGPQAPPGTLDYDCWTGPAPLGPLMRRSLHYDWHWDFATGNGDLGNQGIHQMDACRWAVGADALSPAVLSIGGRFGYADDADTPNTLITLHDYRPAPVLFEVRGLPRDLAAQGNEWNNSMDRYDDVRIGVVVHCEKGKLVIPNYKKAVAYAPEGEVVEQWEESADHFANFVDAVRSRRSEDLSSDINEGHLSSGLCHTGNISYRMGSVVDSEETRAAAKGNAPLAEAYGRLCAHLEANGVDLGKTPAVLGAALTMDPETERFTDERANRLLSRDYRAPYTVPTEV